MAHCFLCKNKYITIKPECSVEYKIYQFKLQDIYQIIYRNMFFKEFNHVKVVFEKGCI